MVVAEEVEEEREREIERENARERERVEGGGKQLRDEWQHAADRERDG